MIKLEQVQKNPVVNALIKKGNENLGFLGYTEHGYQHINLVADIAKNILQKLGYNAIEVELAAIAGFLHDIGNVISRELHGEMGAMLAYQILSDMEMSPEYIASVIGAIGNHDEQRGQPVSAISAALIIADKSHVHRHRVRNKDFATFDIHDRVNYAVETSELDVDAEAKVISLKLSIDINICPVVEYFEIFLTRMVMCRRAAVVLGCDFELCINGAKLI